MMAKAAGSLAAVAQHRPAGCNLALHPVARQWLNIRPAPWASRYSEAVPGATGTVGAV